MYINRLNNSISSKNQPTFNAKIVMTDDYKNYLKYIYKNSIQKTGCYNTKINTDLSEKIEYAFSKHPSDAEITPSIQYRYGELFNARGILKSKYGMLTDVEPARSDSGTAPIENILRKVLDPGNKKALNVILGKKYSNETDLWWKRFIAPIWKQISETFREETFPGSLSMDKQFNKAFNKQIQ